MSRLRGTLQESLLRAIIQLDTASVPPTGSLIQLKLRELGDAPSLGTIHSSLNNMVKRGYVEKEQTKKGRKCLWKVTIKGQEKLSESYSPLEKRKAPVFNLHANALIQGCGSGGHLPTPSKLKQEEKLKKPNIRRLPDFHKKYDKMVFLFLPKKISIDLVADLHETWVRIANTSANNARSSADLMYKREVYATVFGYWKTEILSMLGVSNIIRYILNLW